MDEQLKESAPIQSQESQEIVQKVNVRYQSAHNYITAEGYTRQWAEFDRFWNGEHWNFNKMIEQKDTSKYPRPITNHFAEIIDIKVAALNYERPELYFEPHPGSMPKGFQVQAEALMGEETPKFEISASELMSAIFKEIELKNNMRQKYESFSRSAAVLSNGILFSYFDNSIEGPGYIGDIAVKEIDISDFYVGSPEEPEMQKQPYVIIPERLPRRQVVEEYAEHSDVVKYLQKESETRRRVYKQERPEHDQADNVTLYHYWEKTWVDHTTKIYDPDGEAYKEITRKKAQIDYYVVCQDFVIREKKVYSKRYPFSSFAWHPRRKSFHGKPESKDLINNQKELNRLQAIALLGAYKTGVPNILFKSGFVKREDIAVGPGGDIIEDNTPAAQGWGISYMQPPTIAPYIPLLKDSLSGGMKDASGAHDAFSGKAPSAHLNASAIMALQEAAGVRMKGIQDRFHGAITEMGLIWLELIQKHYTEQRKYRVFGKNNVEGIAWYDPETFKKIDFQPRVAVSSASPYSKTVMATTLESMYDKGIIDADIYRRMLPPEVFPKIKELIALVEERELEQQQLVIEQQKMIIDEIVAQTINQAREAGVEITPEALQEMRLMIQQVGEEQANEEGGAGQR